MLLVSSRPLLGRFWGTSNMCCIDIHTNKYKRKRVLVNASKLANQRVNIKNAFGRIVGLIFGLVAVGAYFGFILYILCFIHQTPITYP